MPLLAAYAASYAIWEDATGNLVTALHTGWGDLFFHIRAAIFFVEQGGIPQESFFLAGEPVGYAYLADWISGIGWYLGMSLSYAFAIPTIILATITIIVMQWLTWYITRSAFAGIMSTVLFMGFSGISGWITLSTLIANRSVSWWETLRALPYDITAWHDAHLVILNPFIMMLHQRAYLLGFPLLLLTLYAAYRYMVQARLYYLALVVVASVFTALAHPFTWAGLSLILPSWMIWQSILIKKYNKSDYAWAIAALAFISIAGLLIVKHLQPSAGTPTIQWQVGWLAEDMSWLVFWLKNIGLYAIAIPFAIYHLLRHHKPLATLTLASLTPFVAGNLFQFSPWIWDNTKMFAPTWVIFAIATAATLGYFWETRHFWYQTVIVIIVPALILSGLLEILRAVSYRSQPFTIHTAQEQLLGAQVRSITQPRDLILTEPVFSNPIFVYSGRPSLVAYEGWLWSQGWVGQYEQKIADTRLIYKGGDQARQLLQSYNIAYVSVGPPEVAAGANKQWFDAHYPAALVMNQYTLYKVSP